MALPLFLSLAQLLIVTSAQSSSSQSSATITSRATLSSSGASPSSTGSKSPQTQTVKVGSGGFKFNPDNITAQVGDTIVFEFYPPDHSVARAEYMSPCVPFEDTGKNKVGFYSGVQLVPDVNHLTYWNLTVNSTEPIFLYCTAKGSCIEQQMVAVINENSTQTLETQREFAKNSTLMLAPGEEVPSEASSSLAAPSSKPTNTSPATSSPADHHDHDHHSLSGGAIAGIAVGGAVFLALCAALFFFVGRTKSLKEVIERRDATMSKTPGTPGTPGDFPGSPGHMSPGFSPMQQQAEFARMSGQNLPPYQQHHVSDQHPSGWTSPQMQQMQMAGMGMVPQQQQQQQQQQEKQDEPHIAAELASPQQQSFAAELEAPMKSPR